MKKACRSLDTEVKERIIPIYHMVDVLRAINPLETHEVEVIQNAADSLAAQVESQPKIFLDRTGTISDPVLAAVFSTMQERSLEGRYHAPDGRQRIFYHMPYDGEALLALDTPEGKEAALVNLASFTAQVPAFLDRARTGIVQARRKGPDRVWDGESVDLPTDPVALMKDFIKSYLEDHRGEVASGTWRNIRNVAALLGNPTVELYGRSGREQFDLLQDPDLPVLTPIFDVRMNPELVTENPAASLRAYSDKIEPFMKRIDENRLKRETVMNPEEISLADQSREIVSLLHNMTYISTAGGTPYVSGIVAAPLFPLDLIHGNYGYYYENWLNFGPNDDLSDLFNRYPVEKI